MLPAIQMVVLAGEMAYRSREVTLLVVVCGGIAAVCLGLWWYFSRMRKLKAWAQRHGLTFRWLPGHRYGHPDLAAFCKREDAKVSTVIHGRYKGHTITGFDFTTGQKFELKLFRDKNSQKWTTKPGSAVFLKVDMPLRRLHIAPERLADKFQSRLTGQDINFESRAFNKKFVVRAESKKWAFAVITPRVMELLLARPKFHVEFDYGGIIAYRLGRFEAAEFEQAADVVSGIRSLMPEYVIQEMEATSE
ncbi:MAG: DUF3137 domain-containing protein [Planctomycetota bacterium]